jgi:uncharacterized protein involved in outer membrane biogenesis
VLPDRRFDLPSLRAMEANVLIDVAHLDLGTALLEPLEPLRTHLRLSGGVLTLSDLDARTAQGPTRRRAQPRRAPAEAIWKADLDLIGVRLERWLHQAPPERASVRDGPTRRQVKVTGSGRSTAEILGSLDGGYGSTCATAACRTCVEVAESISRRRSA